jgi:hypothetical protein
LTTPRRERPEDVPEKPAVFRALASARRKHARFAEMSFPQSYPLLQVPNAPLIVGLLALLIASALRGDAHSVALAVAYLGLAIWAYLELLDGANLVRRLLGLVVVIAIALHLASLIRH